MLRALRRRHCTAALAVVAALAAALTWLLRETLLGTLPEAAAARPITAVAVGPVPPYLENTAIITLATGDESARHAVALIQSLRDTNTQVPHIVALLSRGGTGSTSVRNQTWMTERGRAGVRAGAADASEEEITEPIFLAAFRRLGVETMIIEPMPETNYTPTGRTTWWGMSFNKLRIFGMTRFRKILFLDSDVLVLRNLDHVLKEPMFTGAVTFACCNFNAPGLVSGGMWVIEPSAHLLQFVLDLVARPVPGKEDKPKDEQVWRTSDLGVAQHAFTQRLRPGQSQPMFPSLESNIHGIVPGLEYLPEFKAMTPEELKNYMLRVPEEKRGRVGFMEDVWRQSGSLPEFPWHPLDMRYDQVVGHCECLPGRDIPDDFFSVHFSCMFYIEKPARHASEHAFLTHLRLYALSCTRYYYLRWLDAYNRGMQGRLPPPYYEGPAIPVWDAAHDDVVRANRLADGVTAVDFHSNMRIKAAEKAAAA